MSEVNSWPRAGSRALWLVSPRLERWQKKILSHIQKRVPQDPNIIWLMSSGSQSVGSVKCIGLSRDAILASANAVNRHLRANAKDRWLVTLPTYHIGGFSILARAHLTGSKVSFLKKWNVNAFLDQVIADGVTLVSLVPTQVFDLVQYGKSLDPRSKSEVHDTMVESVQMKRKRDLKRAEALKSLRAVIVGGGSLDEDLFANARAHGWPIFPSYGLTETASQVATAELSSLQLPKFEYPALKILSHLKVEICQQRVFLHGLSLASYVATGNVDGVFTLEVAAPRGWLSTEDLAVKTADTLKPLGRRDDVVKILGVLVSVAEVETKITDFFRGALVKDGRIASIKKLDLAVVPSKREREGHVLVLVASTDLSLKEIEADVEIFNAAVPGPQRIRQICWTASIPRSDLGKIKRAQLRADLRL